MAGRETVMGPKLAPQPWATHPSPKRVGVSNSGRNTKYVTYNFINSVLHGIRLIAADNPTRGAPLVVRLTR